MLQTNNHSSAHTRVNEQPLLPSRTLLCSHTYCAVLACGKLIIQVKMEEKSLLERYGQVYADYKAKVKCFFPY